MVNNSLYREHDYLNKQGERLQVCGDIIMNLEYWDCECPVDFIHPIEIVFCPICGSWQEESPSSRENEIQIVKGRQ